MRAVRPPVSPLYLGYQRSNSNSIPSSPLDISFEINGSTDANLGALRSPTKSNIRTSTTKMKIESPSSIMSIMSITTVENDKAARKALLKAKKENDSMVFVDGPQVYTCSNCRTHLTSHDDIISKSFHGRHGRAYLFDECVNVIKGPEENRRLMTGLHVVSDIHCKRCKKIVGWTYSKAYERSQKYKEGKFVIEKINLHLEESPYYQVSHPAGERDDRWRKRSMSWGSTESPTRGYHDYPEDMIYEYRPPDSLRSMSLGSHDSSTITPTSVTGHRTNVTKGHRTRKKVPELPFSNISTI